ncbi:MAG: chemotaxis protein CheD [Elusimicrobiales bacterium]|nr:chemotaxis protein CheD [Elusimicrobiales bacterium]
MITVNVGDFKFSSDQDEEIITYALGSCVGVSFFDSVLKKGGMLHAMLDDCDNHKEKCISNPFMFVNSGMELALKKFIEEGSDKKNLIICACGGASPIAKDRQDFFQIGMKNVIMLKKIMWKYSLIFKATHFGGYSSRTMKLSLRDGSVIVKTPTEEFFLYQSFVNNFK